MSTFGDVFSFSDHFLINCRPYRIRDEDRDKIWKRLRGLVLQIQDEDNRPDFEELVVNTPEKVTLSEKSELAFATLKADFEDLLSRPVLFRQES